MKPSPSALALADNLRKLLVQTGLDVRDLVKASGKSKSIINYYLAYKEPTDRHAALDTVDAMAAALGVAGRDLITPGYADVKARPLQPVTRRAIAGAGDRTRGTSSNASVDAELLQLILEGMDRVKHRKADRARIAADVYARLQGGEEATPTNVLRLVHSAK